MEWGDGIGRATVQRVKGGNNKPLAEGDDDDNNKYDKDSKIPDDSAPPTESIARSHHASQRASMPPC
jgi:hypothetical protein